MGSVSEFIFVVIVVAVVGCLPVLWFNCKWFFIDFVAGVSVAVLVVVDVVFNLVWCTMTLYYYGFLKR